MESTIKTVDDTIMKICSYVNKEIDNINHENLGTITESLASLINARATWSKVSIELPKESAQENDKKGLARMRTIDAAVELIKKEDPDSNITANLLRQGIKSGKIPTVKIGKKALINVDSCLDGLSSCELQAADDMAVPITYTVPQKRNASKGGIRPVSL